MAATPQQTSKRNEFDKTLRKGARTPSNVFPAAPIKGDLFYETTTDKLWAFNGTDWVQQIDSGAWDAFTPTHTNIIIGNGTELAFFTRVGRTIHGRYNLTFGSTTSFSGNVQVGMPVNIVGGTNLVGSAWILDSGILEYIGICRAAAAGSVFVITDAGSAVNATTPFTWTTNDQLALNFTYEAAASV